MRNLYKIRPGDTLYRLSKRYRTTVENIIQSNPNLNPYDLRVGDVIHIYPDMEYTPQTPANNETYTAAELKLMNALRSVWEEHVKWTRMAIISIAANLPDTELVSQRLMRNAADMGALFAPYYGDAGAKKISDLIHEHLDIAAKLVVAAKNGDTVAASNYETQWTANADEIAAHLTGINPNFNRDDLRAMLYRHLALTKTEAVARLSGDYAKDISTFDTIENQALDMADALSAGIVRQFPERFTH